MALFIIYQAQKELPRHHLWRTILPAFWVSSTASVTQNWLEERRYIHTVGQICENEGQARKEYFESVGAIWRNSPVAEASGDEDDAFVYHDNYR